MTLHGHQAAVTSVQFDQSRIISGSLDRFIKIWSISSGQVRVKLMATEYNNYTIHVSV